MTLESSLPKPRRRAGVGLHVSSLPGAHGIGDLAEGAHAFIDRLVEMNVGVWQFLPLGPTAYGDSPYQPLSAFAGNANLIGLQPLVELGLLRAAELDTLTGLPEDFVDYGRLIPAKRDLLSRAAERFAAGAGGTLVADYEMFLHENAEAWLDDYALFRVLKTRHGERPWPEWEPAFVHREPMALAQAWDHHRDAIECTRITQFLFDQQWRALKDRASERNICLFGDMPIYIALDSADAWSNREMLEVDRDGQPSAVAGVPPDYFSEDGQLWGNPLYDWDYHRRTGYQWWVERVRHAARQSHLLRIDHFRGFAGYWSVPNGAPTAREGEWLPGPDGALFDAIEQGLGKLPIVAEDLGVITPDVDALRERYGIPGMVVLQFAVCDPEFDIQRVEANSVCYTGTHDNDTTQGWFRGSGDDTRTQDEIEAARHRALELTGGQPETIHLDLARLAFSTAAALALAPMQDFLGLGSEARLNRPGTTQGNWQWRLRGDALTPEVIDTVSGLAEASGRAHR